MNIELHVAKNGEETLKVNDYFIHSRYNPSKEAIQMAERQYMPHHVHIIFGYGKGHLINAMIKERQFQEVIIVVDPLFDNEQINRPPSDEQQKVYFLTSHTLNNFEQYLGYLVKDRGIKYKVLHLPNYDKLFPQQCRLLFKKVKDVQNRNLINVATLLRFSEIWYVNFLENLKYLAKDYSGKVLERAYSVPAVIVSGGPSLAKQINLLKMYRKQIIVICAGSTINSLLKEEIEPDYVVTIDGGEANCVHFDHLILENAKIVYTMQNQPKVRHTFKKPGYVVESKGYEKLTRFITDELKLDLPLFLGGASVAHTAFNFAQLITTGPIALIGQDLAYTHNLTHARGVAHAKHIDEDFIRKRQAFQVIGYDGEKVWTDPVFNSMRLEFEDLIKLEPPENLFFNCTEGGIKIEGFEQISFKYFCEQFATKQFDIIEHDVFNHHFDVKEKLYKEWKQYKKLLDLVNEAAFIVKKNYSKKYFDSASLNRLDKLDEKIKAQMNVLTIELLIAPITMRVTQEYLPKENETGLEKFNRAYSQMEDLYESMKIKIKEAIEVISEIIERGNSNE